MASWTLERRFVPRIDIPDFDARWKAFQRGVGNDPLNDEGLLTEGGGMIERWVPAGDVTDEGWSPAMTIEKHLEALKAMTGAEHRVVT